MGRPAVVKRPESLRKLEPPYLDEYDFAERFGCTLKDAREHLEAMKARPIGPRLVTTETVLQAWMERGVKDE